MKYSLVTNDPRFESLIAALRSCDVHFENLPDIFQRRIQSLVQYSPRLTAICTAKPEYLVEILDEEILGKLYKINDYKKILKECLARSDDPETALRAFHRREMIRIAWRDLCNLADIQDITEELSDLAQTVISAVYRIEWKRMTEQYGIPISQESGEPAQFCVIGVGKLGGRELNFSSDIDLMFVYDHEGETRGGEGKPLHNSIFFQQLAQGICDVLTRPTPEGFLYRVDTRLRPEGSSGALAVSLMTIEIYYHTYGANWERQALLKARPVAGEGRVGFNFMSVITPFTYRKYVDELEIAEVLRSIDIMRQKSIANIGGVKKQAVNFKNGYGGIRDIEFFVQAVQMLYGGQYPEIKLNGTLVSLLRMHESHLLHTKDFDFLTDAYRFLRKIEHRLQMVSDQQVYELPSDPNARFRLAKSLDFDSYDTLKAKYDDFTKGVRKIYEGVFLRAEWADPSELIIDSETFDDRIGALLESYEFHDSKRAFQFLRALLKSPDTHLQPKTTRLFKAMLPRLLQYLKNSPDPDLALANFESLVSSFKARSALYESFCDQPNLLDLLVSVTSSSQFLTRLVKVDPSLMESLGRDDALENTITVDSLWKHYQIISNAYPTDERRDWLLRVENAAILQCGIRFILGLSDVETIERELSDIADFVLERSMEPARESLVAKFPEFTRDYGEEIAVVGFGKLGGREFNIASDCDICFIYSESRMTKETSSREYFQRWAAKYCVYLEDKSRLGFLYIPDTRLRPFGKSAPLASSKESFLEYYRDRAQFWEKMALTRARVVCGNPAIQAFLDDLKEELLFQTVPSRKDLESILTMREKIEKYKSEETLKAGPGGIVDVEFIAQTLTLYYGPSHTSMRKSATLEIIRAASQEGLIPQEEGTALIESYRFLREVENRLRIVDNVSIDSIPKDPEELEKLTRRYALRLDTDKLTPEGFLETIANHTHTVREIYTRFFDDLLSGSGE